MFKIYIKPIVVLTAICLVLSGALAGMNYLTYPVIEAAAVERAGESMKVMIPEATAFEPIDISIYASMPDAVKEAYRTTNEVGYVFVAVTPGFSGDITIMCAISSDGRIIAVETLSHTETAGIGTIIEQESFLGTFISADNRLSGVDTVTGATISTKAYIGAIRDVFAAFEIIKNS